MPARLVFQFFPFFFFFFTFFISLSFTTRLFAATKGSALSQAGRIFRRVSANLKKRKITKLTPPPPPSLFFFRPFFCSAVIEQLCSMDPTPPLRSAATGVDLNQHGHPQCCCPPLPSLAPAWPGPGRSRVGPAWPRPWPRPGCGDPHQIAAANKLRTSYRQLATMLR